MLFVAVLASIAAWGVLSAVRSRAAAAAGFSGARFLWISAAPGRGPLRFTALTRVHLASAPPTASARIYVHPRFTLWINGKPAGSGGQRPGEPAAVIPVAALLRAGENTVAIVAESPDGVGAILFALDAGGGRPAAVSDASWTVDPAGASIVPPGARPAADLGPPPRYPWGSPASTR